MTQTIEIAVDCSVIVPCKNEAGNVARLLDSIPPLGGSGEIIFVLGPSEDGTDEVVRQCMGAYRNPHYRVSALKQKTIGKWPAVREGFDAARGQVLVILDGDFTVHPRELTQFYQSCEPGAFVNGSRLVHPMEPGAMRPLNRIGNHVFARVCSVIVGDRLTDSLCGTKCILRSDWMRIRDLFPDLVERDPFGDHALLYGASRLGLSIREIPVHYMARTYGTTQIRRFSHGWQLMKLALWEVGQRLTKRGSMTSRDTPGAWSGGP